MVYVKAIERRIRYLMITFCSFSSFHSLVKVVKENLGINININNVFILILLAIFGVITAWWLVAETKEAVGDSLEPEPDDDIIERIQIEFIWFTGLFVLLFFTQVGITIFFFPEFEHYTTFFGLKLYIVTFIIDSIVMYILYRLTILKWSWRYQ